MARAFKCFIPNTYNISGQSWRSAGDNIARQYDYIYDATNRLMKAEFEQDKGGWGKTLDFNSYMGTGNPNDPNSAYDLNGNIKRMQQWGLTPQNVIAQVDNLTYSYSNASTAAQTFSNKLLAVNDLSTVTGLGDFENRNTSATDYVYDGNGNMTKDYNKRIGKAGTTAAVRGITYNHLNLPDTLFIFSSSGTAKGRIYYLSDANGQKLRKTVVENSILMVVNGVTFTTHDTTFTHYLGGMVYQSKNYSNSTVRNNLRYSYQLQFCPCGSSPVSCRCGSYDPQLLKAKEAANLTLGNGLKIQIFHFAKCKMMPRNKNTVQAS